MGTFWVMTTALLGGALEASAQARHSYAKQSRRCSAYGGRARVMMYTLVEISRGRERAGCKGQHRIPVKAARGSRLPGRW